VATALTAPHGVVDAEEAPRGTEGRPAATGVTPATEGDSNNTRSEDSGATPGTQALLVRSRPTAIYGAITTPGVAQISLGAGRRSDFIKAGATKHVPSHVCVHRYLGLARIGRCSIASNAVAFCSRCLMRRSAAAGAEGSLRRDRRHHPAAQVREQLWAVAEAGNMARLWLAQNEVAFVPEGWEACRGLGGWGCCGTHQYTKASLLKISKTSSVPQ
jgi:hypothetical protein